VLLEMELRMAFRNLAKRKLRTALTAAGIAVGVALILSLLSMVASAEVAAQQAFRRITGYDIVIVNASVRGGFLRAPAGVAGAQNLIKEEVVYAVALVDGVYAVTPVLAQRTALSGVSVTVYGVDPQTFEEVYGALNVVEGGFLSCSDCYEVVIGRALSEELGLSVGSRLALTLGSTNLELTVRGVYEVGMRFQELAIYVPIEVLQRATGLEGYVSYVLVKCVDPREVSQVVQALSEALPGLSVISQTAIAGRVTEALNTLTYFFMSIGLVALTAGGFGVMNTMFMSVAERTREIGIMKAVGARDRDIFALFVLESTLVGLIGGSAGALAGVLLSHVLPSAIGGYGFTGLVRAVRRATPTPTQALTIVVKPENVLLSLAIGIAVSVLAGLLPAYRAARMRPAEAVRYV